MLDYERVPGVRISLVKRAIYYIFIIEKQMKKCKPFSGLHQLLRRGVSSVSSFLRRDLSDEPDDPAGLQVPELQQVSADSEFSF